MSLIVKESAGMKREPIPAGVKTAVCSAIIDLGEQESEWKGKTKRANKVLFIWEVPSETIETEDGPLPRTISKQYTFSLHERSGLRKMLQSWRGKNMTAKEAEGFDLTSMLGKGCLLSIVHTVSPKDGNTYANIDTVMGLPEGITAPTATHLVSYDMDSPDALDALELLPEWVQNRIKAGNTYAVLAARDAVKAEDELMNSDEDKPF